MEEKALQDALVKGLEPISKKIDDIDSRVSAIEKLPLEKGVVNVNTIPTVYKGRKLSKQGAFFRNAKGLESLGNEQKADEFCKFMLDVVTKTTLNETTSAQGAYLVPDEYQWDIVQLARNRSYALQLARILGMSSDKLLIPAELTLPSVNWKAESAQLSQSDPTFRQVELNAKKLTAYSWATDEVLADSAIDIVSLLTEQFSYGIGLELDNQMINGTGDPVSGLGTANCGYSVVLSGAVMSAITADDLSLAISKLEQGDLANAKFLIGRLALHYIRTLKDANDAPIFANPAGNVSGTIYQFPYFMTEKIANVDGDSKLMAILGDFDKFVIGRRNGAMAIEVDPYGRFDYCETRFRLVSRWALAVARNTAFVRILS